MNTRKILTIGIIGIVLIVAVSAGLYYQYFTKAPTVKAEIPVAVDENATEESVASLVDIINAFSLDLYKDLCSQSDENEFISPYSIFVALAMTYEGAQGETAEQMQEVLGIPQDDNTMQCSFGYLYNLLNQEKEYTLRTANALWTQEGFPFLSSYLEYLENYYIAHAQDVDFSKAAQTADIINTWVEEQTNGMIKDFLSSGDIDPMTRLILTNAIYFKGDWKHAFDETDTTNSDFILPSGDSVTVPMMHFTDTDVSFNYTETDAMQMVELPYKGDDVSMYILLPTENTMSDFEGMVTLENLTNWKHQMIPTTLQLSLPRFSLEEEYRVDSALKTMGMTIPFTTSADFSGIDGAQDLYIEKVKHKALVEVNEQGTEAAAVTSVHMALTAIQPGVIMNCDHPFLFFIQQNDTGSILFMGKVTNPS